ncbi:MAG: hypothetical protein ACLTW9_17505 [Enterocloster sp.]
MDARILFRANQRQKPVSEPLYFVTQTDYRPNKREREFIRFLRDFAALERTDALTKKDRKEDSPLFLALSPMLFLL